MRFDNLRVKLPASPRIENRFRRPPPVPKLITELRATPRHRARTPARSATLRGPRPTGPTSTPSSPAARHWRARGVGESVEGPRGRPLPMVSFGEGNVGVLAWSQMQRTMPLADIFSLIAGQPEHALVGALSHRLSLPSFSCSTRKPVHNRIRFACGYAAAAWQSERSTRSSRPGSSEEQTREPSARKEVKKAA